jgi:hypothetical protein
MDAAADLFDSAQGVPVATSLDTPFTGIHAPPSMPLLIE